MNGGSGPGNQRAGNRSGASRKNRVNKKAAVPASGKKRRKNTELSGTHAKSLLNEYYRMLEMKYGMEQKIARLAGGSTGLVSLLDCMQAEAKIGNCEKFAFYGASYVRKATQLDSLSVRTYLGLRKEYLLDVERYLKYAERQLKSMDDNEAKKAKVKQYEVLLHADKRLMLSDELITLYDLLQYAGQKIREGNLTEQRTVTADALKKWSNAVDNAAKAKKW